MIRSRIPGEQIGAGDVITIGEKAFPVLNTCLIGMPVLRGSINAVYTSEPVTTLQEPFPAKVNAPICPCGNAAGYHDDGRYYCSECWQDMLEAAL